MTRSIRILWPAMALLLLSSACAVLPYVKVENALRAGSLDTARAELTAAESEYGPKAHLLYLFDQTALAHYAGDWKASNGTAEQAEALIDQLYTKSLTAEAASFLLNDMSRPYVGENFERVLLNVMAMINYAGLGDRDGAMVEARRVDERLQQYAQTVGEDKVGYREDALARYLSAFLYEGGTRQELWDAYLDYKKADEAFDLYAKLYGTAKPQRLKADLQRLADGLGETDDLEHWRQRDGEQRYHALREDRNERAEVLVLLYDGLAPVKVSKSMNVPVRLDDGTQQYFSLALPDFVVRAEPTPIAELLVGPRSTPFELFEDVNAIAVRDLQDRSGLILARASARALAKFQTARALQQKARESGGGAAELLTMLGTNLFSVLSEQADIRSWRTLPGRIWLARLSVEPGERSLRLHLRQGGQEHLIDLGTQSLKPGEKRLLVKTLF